MSGRYLLDTNVAIQILNQELDLEAKRGSGIEVMLCLTVVGELFFGAAKSTRAAENRRRIGNLLALCPVVPHDLGTTELYGDVKARLRAKGRPIPENDVWIAAGALQHDLILVTQDRHFREVEGLQVEAW